MLLLLKSMSPRTRYNLPVHLLFTCGLCSLQISKVCLLAMIILEVGSLTAAPPSVVLENRPTLLIDVRYVSAVTRESSSTKRCTKHTNTFSLSSCQCRLHGGGVPEFYGRPSHYTEGTDFLGTPPDHLDVSIFAFFLPFHSSSEATTAPQESSILAGTKAMQLLPSQHCVTGPRG